MGNLKFIQINETLSANLLNLVWLRFMQVLKICLIKRILPE